MSSHRPAVTVVVPSHNDLQDLPKALESVYRQDIDGLELIVVDDSSEDGTHDFLARLQDVHSSLRIIKTRGIGACSARNMAIDTAKSDLIAFLDATDQWQDGKLASQLAFHRIHPQLQFSFSRMRYLNRDPAGNDVNFWEFNCRSVKPEKGYQLLPTQLAAMLFASNPVATSTVVARRSALLAVGGFDQQLSSASEWDLWLKLLLRGQVAAGNMISCQSPAPAGQTDRQRHVNALRQIIARYRNQFAENHHAIVRCAEAHLSQEYANMYWHQRHWLKALVWDTRAWLLQPSKQQRRRQHTL